MSPGAAGLLDAAIAVGTDVVGALDPASFDRDIEKHLDVVFGVADRHVGIDVHLHDPGTLVVFELEQIAAPTPGAGHGGTGGGEPRVLSWRRRAVRIIADGLATAGVASMIGYRSGFCTDAPPLRLHLPRPQTDRSHMPAKMVNDAATLEGCDRAARREPREIPWLRKPPRLSLTCDSHHDGFHGNVSGHLDSFSLSPDAICPVDL